MFEVVLFEPEIPPNTGNIIRLCANTGARLHLIEPLGFDLDDRKLRRAGLDYHEWATLQRHTSFAAYRATRPEGRKFAFTTRGQLQFDEIAYRPGDSLIFGPETRGLPDEILTDPSVDNTVFIPMSGNGRSLNLSNAVAVAVYEAWRQQGFA